MIFFGLDRSPWFHTEMPMDNKDLVSMDFWITHTPFLACTKVHPLTWMKWFGLVTWYVGGTAT